ncbi:hypothetical protein [Streptomyces sp. 8K308]
MALRESEDPTRVVVTSRMAVGALIASVKAGMFADIDAGRGGL